MEGERLKREVELQRQRLQELVQQQMQARPAWQTMLLPALGAGFFALLLGKQSSFLETAAAPPMWLYNSYISCSAYQTVVAPRVSSAWRIFMRWVE